MKPLTAVALTAVVSLSAAKPISPSSTIHARQDQTSSGACAQVSSFLYGDGTQPVKQQVPAQLAWDCVNSVPFNASSAKRLVAGLRPYMEWQSTLIALKNPPADYASKVQPPVDILGGLNQLDTYIDTFGFKSEYEFGWSLYSLIQSAHDGHFGYTPDIVGDIFTWGRPTPLVSVSADGMQLPAVFVFSDVVGMQFKNISYQPSPVAQIDGEDVKAWLEELSQKGSLQDRDALYNNLFYELAQVSLATSGSATGAFTGGGRGRFVYPGPTTTLTFANGTELTMQNFAKTRFDFRNVTSGEDLGKVGISWGSADPESLAKKPQPPTGDVPPEAFAAGAPGYPAPVVAGPNSLINGFYLNVSGYEDVAVLQVPNFVSLGSAEVPFQALSQQFIPKALADGKTKLIIDLQANGGGTILQGYDMFKQLFPDIDPYGANRFRAHEAVELVGEAYSEYASQFPRSGFTSGTILQAVTSYFNYGFDETVGGKPFGSWAEKYGPVELNGDKYTTLSRWNLSDPNISYVAGGISITGYGPLANITGPPKFKPENIVLVTDGYCASTCTIFAELMIKQAGVKTIAMGGRSNKDKIQAVGGVKGVNNFLFSYIEQVATNAVSYKPTLLGSTLSDYQDGIVPKRASGTPGVNVRDGLRQNDDSGTALQFIYDEADCRLYYTPEMTVDITSLWKAAADAQWGNSGKCIGASKKRGTQQVTTKLSPRRVQVSHAVAEQRVAAFENSFSLETENKLNGDGFMTP